jgi:hypothetical protein
MELLRVGKRLEQEGKGIFIDLWPEVLSYCGRGWFETESETEFIKGSAEWEKVDESETFDGDGLALPTF